MNGPQEALAGLAASTRPYLIGVRHHSPALAGVVPALLDAAGAEVVCVELPADFQPWLEHLAHPGTVAPVALAGAAPDGAVSFYPFADFSPELTAIRWARERGVEVLCCDLPLSDPGWSAHGVPGDEPVPPTPPGHAEVAYSAGAGRRNYADALAAGATGRDGDDMWDRAVEVLAPGCAPEAVRRAALGIGWALRRDAATGNGVARTGLENDESVPDPDGGVSRTDLAREAHMRAVIAEAAASGSRVAAVIGAFHAPALTGLPPGDDTVRPSTAGAGPLAPPKAVTAPATAATETTAAPPTLTRESKATPPTLTTHTTTAPATVARDQKARATATVDSTVVTSLVPYTFGLLDSRSGYPAGIRDPRWQQAVLKAGGDPGRVRDAAARAITDLCRELRAAGHTAGTGEAAETLRLACDLARLRSLPAPGRGEVLEAVTAVLGQGEPLGRGRALAKALEVILVGSERGRTAPGTPRSGLGPAVEAELSALRLPGPDAPESREVRLDPLRSDLDRRREVLLQRLSLCGVGYGTQVEVAATGDGNALTTRWRISWSPSVPARLDLAGVRGVSAAQAAAGTLRETFRRQTAEGGPTCEQVLSGLGAAARCDLPDMVAERLSAASALLPASATLPEILDALDLLEALRRDHLPGTTTGTKDQAAALTDTLIEAAVRSLPGLAGSDRPEDITALVTFATRAGEHRLGLRLDDALGTLARTGSPRVQGAALAARVLLELDDPDDLGDRVAGWVDAATGPDGRGRLSRLLGGLLAAAGPLLQSAPTALGPLLDRVGGLTDQGFLDRLPALRGGFDTLSPAGRDRLLRTVTERLGDHLDLALSAPPELLALWTAADTAGLTAIADLRLPLPVIDASPARTRGLPDGINDATGDGHGEGEVRGDRHKGAHLVGPPPNPGRTSAEEPSHAGTAKQPEPADTAANTDPASAIEETERESASGETGRESTAKQPEPADTAKDTNGADADDQTERANAAEHADPTSAIGDTGRLGARTEVEREQVTRLGPADRWRLLLGRERERLPADARRYAHALDELYGAGQGEGAGDFGRGPGDERAGGRQDSFPTAREWAKELESLFGSDVREEVLARAAEAGRADVLAELDPTAARPSVELLTSVLSLAGGLPERQLSRLRPLVRRLVDELARELATRLRPALTGLATPRPTRRPGGRLDLARTLRANLAHTRRLDDGRTVVVPERPVFSTRSRREADWRLILVVDVSGSMEASVIWSALTAAVLGGVPTLSTHFLAFSTQVIDLSDRVSDPLSLLLEVRVGGGTHIAAGLAHARSLVTVPSRTLVVVVSDFEEGYALGGLLGEVRALSDSGVHLLGCAALDDTGVPRYSVPIAQRLVAAGMPVAALSPLALARWVGDRLRGETR